MTTIIFIHHSMFQNLYEFIMRIGLKFVTFANKIVFKEKKRNMKHKITAIIFMLFVTQISFAQKWGLAKDKNGIKVYTRSIEGSSFKEFKGITQMNGDIASFVSLMRDVPNFTVLFESCVAPKLLKREGETIQIHYLQTEAPWPVTNRDGIYKYVFEYDSEKQELLVDLKALPDYNEKNENFIRVPKATGYWKVKNLGNQQIEVTYQLHADPGGAIPGWLANSSSIDLPFNTLTNVKNRIGVKDYQGKTYNFLK